MVYMHNLHMIANEIRREGVYAVSFCITYNHCGFSNLYIDDYIKPTLFISSLGENPFTIELVGDSEFSFQTFLDKDDYKKLCDYLGISYNPDQPFRINSFFEQYDSFIQKDILSKAHPRDIAYAVNRKEKNADEWKKVYFCGWHPLPDGHKVSDRNFKKTCGLVGYKEALRLRKLNVSSNWSPDDCEENLIKIAESTTYKARNR